MNIDAVVAPGAVAGRHVCLFVTYEPHGKIKRYVRLHLDRLRALGVATVVIVIAEKHTRLNIKQRVGPTSGLLLRANMGHDFGAWADVLRAFPSLYEAETLLLINDSVFGPFGSYEGIFERVLSSQAAFVGLTQSKQHAHHYQSYFLAFRKPSQFAPVREFWSKVENLDREKVIERYELRLLQILTEAGLTSECIFPTSASPGASNLNPMHKGWRELARAGVPYIKVELLRDNPDQVLMMEDWERLVADPEVIKVVKDWFIRGR